MGPLCLHQWWVALAPAPRNRRATGEGPCLLFAKTAGTSHNPTLPQAAERTGKVGQPGLWRPREPFEQQDHTRRFQAPSWLTLVQLAPFYLFHLLDFHLRICFKTGFSGVKIVLKPQRPLVLLSWGNCYRGQVVCPRSQSKAMRDPCLGPCLPAAFPSPPGCLSDLPLSRAWVGGFMKVQSKGLSLGFSQ